MAAPLKRIRPAHAPTMFRLNRIRPPVEPLVLPHRVPLKESEGARQNGQLSVSDRKTRKWGALGGTRTLLDGRANMTEMLPVEAINEQVERIVQNRGLRLSDPQQRLFRYLVEQSLSTEAGKLKEYTIGLDVFGKPPSYDPREESVVRMHVARLRQKLAEHYHGDGAHDPILIELPKGGFKVLFEQRPTGEVVSSAPVEPDAQPTPRRYLREMALAACLVAATLVTWYLAARPTRAPQATTDASLTAELQQLWSPILDSNRPLVVCLATPATGSSSTGTASGAFLLGQFLASRKQHLLLTRGDLLSMPEIMMDNVIFVGPVAGNHQIEAVPADQPIALETNGIRNRNPRPGEPVFLPDREAPGSADTEAYALISHIPGLYGNGEILSLSGNRISSVMAAVQALTDPSLARTVVSHLRSPQGHLPRYFQVVLKVKSMDDMPVDIAYVFHREVSQERLATVAAVR
jgi:hypothetical protein